MFKQFRNGYYYYQLVIWGDLKFEVDNILYLCRKLPSYLRTTDRL